MEKTIRRWEEFSINAWPALQTQLYDGWVVRFANGYTKRANSVTPLYPSTIDIGDKLRYCQALYRRRGQKVVFKLTPAAEPADLDRVLERAGYRLDSPTSVQTMDLAMVAPANGKATLVETVSDDWLGEFARLSAINERNRLTLKQMLSGSAAVQCYASMTEQGRVIGCGLGVVQPPYVGLFDIITDPEFRNRGHARSIVLNLLDWGKRQGATTGFLQVMQNNAPAMHLYTALGFQEIYRYWYRIKE